MLATLLQFSFMQLIDNRYTMADLVAMTLYAHFGGPNPWKVAIICEELDLPYQLKFMDLTEVKSEPFLSLNPNGRLPVLEDPNTNVRLWEVIVTGQLNKDVHIH